MVFFVEKKNPSFSLENNYVSLYPRLHFIFLRLYLAPFEAALTHRGPKVSLLHKI